MTKKKIMLDSGAILIACFIVFAIVSVVVIAIKDTTVRTECIKAGGNMEFGECRMCQESH